MRLRLSRYVYSLCCLIIGLGLNLALSTTGCAKGHVYQFGFPKQQSTVAERARVHQWIPLGAAQFQEGISIPAYGITIEDPIEEGLLKDFTFCQPVTCHFKFKLNAAQAQQLAVYQVQGLGWFLAPRHWKTIEASMGPSEIAALVMFSPDGTQYLSMDDTSACVGCALTSASLFFQEAADEARKNDFWVYGSSNVALKKILLNQQTIIYSYQLPAHYPSHGVAKFTGMQADIVNFRRMTVSLVPEEKALAKAILNFYLLTH